MNEHSQNEHDDRRDDDGPIAHAFNTVIVGVGVLYLAFFALIWGAA